MLYFFYHYYNIWVGLIITGLTEMILFLVGFLFDRNDRSDIRNKVVLIGVIAIFVSSALAISSMIIKDAYTTIPNIKSHTRQQAIQVIAASDLDIDLNDFVYDGVSAPVDDAGLIVEFTEPNIGSLLEKRSKIKIYMTSVDLMIKPISINYQGSQNVKREVYNEIDPNLLYPFNATEFTLYINRKSLDILVDNNEHNRALGSEALSGVTVQLFDYISDKMIEEKHTNDNGSVKFSDLDDGAYYYKVLMAGYKTTVPQIPFRLKHDPNTEINVLPWGVDLEKDGDIYTEEFRIQLLYHNGEPVKYTEVNVCAKNLNNDYTGYSSLPMTSNENGYLTLWHAINGEDFYNIAKFKLNKEYVLELFTDESSFTIDTMVPQLEYKVIFD